ncbi:hypothetical protein RKD47_003117 [Streptomyces albogriseolus]
MILVVEPVARRVSPSFVYSVFAVRVVDHEAALGDDGRNGGGGLRRRRVERSGGEHGAGGDDDAGGSAETDALDADIQVRYPDLP